MKLLTTVFVLTLSISIGYAQKRDTKKDTIPKKVYLKYFPKKKKIEFVNKKDVEIKHGDEYDLIIKGINSATISPKATLKHFNISSDIPEILKPILLGIENSDQFGKSIKDIRVYSGITDSISKTDEEVLAELYDAVQLKVKILETLREKTNSFYKKTLYKPDTIGAIELKNKLLPFFNNPKNKKEFLKEVTASVFYVKGVTNLFKLYIEKTKEPSIQLTLLYAYLQQIESEVSKNNYQKPVHFLYASTKAKDQVDLKSFTAKNKGLDVVINLINSYTKDTVKTQTIDFYTKGNWSFDFSSGFFYSNKVDQGYYLEARDTLINNVRREKSRRGDISIGALAHFTYKHTSCFKSGFNLGASLSPFDGKTRYFLGLSAILGRKSQFAFNTGVSFTKINELSKAVKEDAIGKFVPASVTAVPTFERINTGFYFAITYNLAAKKKYKD